MKREDFRSDEEWDTYVDQWVDDMKELRTKYLGNLGFPASFGTTVNTSSSSELLDSWSNIPPQVCNDPPTYPSAIPAAEPVYGAVCCSCREYFEHAEAREGFRCYSCRLIDE